MKPMLRLLPLFLILAVGALFNPLLAQVLPAEFGDDIQQSQERIPLERILNPDGTVNLTLGIQGTLDPKGWRMTVDHYGRPRFVQADGTLGVAAVASKPGDEQWDDRFGQAADQGGLNDEVFAAVVFNNWLFVGGAFTQAGSRTLNYIARWDGSAWQSLGDGPLNGTNGFVYSLALRSEILYVGGKFSMAGGVPVKNIAQYSIAQRVWAGMGPFGPSQVGLGGDEQAFVGAILVKDTLVYAGGSFNDANGTPVKNIAAWSLSQKRWSAVGDPGSGVNGTVNTIAALKSKIFIGGNFSSVGSVSASGIARWDGANWSSLGNGVNGFVNAIGVMGDTLFVGGSFSMAGDSGAKNIARWEEDSIRWTPVTGVYQLWDSIAPFREDDGVNGIVRSIVVSGRKVYVSGTFQSVFPGQYTLNRVYCGYVAVWNELPESNIWWQTLGYGSRAGTDGFVNAIALKGDDVFVAGSFTTAGGEPSARVARYSAGRWFPFNNNSNGTVTTIARFGEDIYASGKFRAGATGNPLDVNIAALDGNVWSNLSGTVTGPVYSMIGHGDDLYIAGSFRSGNGLAANNIVRWNKTSNAWSLLGTGVNAPTIAFISSMVIKDDKLYVGGLFDTAGTTLAQNVAVWDLTNKTWSKLGTGIDGVVLSLTMDDAGTLYAGGRFLRAGGQPASNVARWDGTTWTPLDSGLNETVFILSARGNYLHAGGDFTASGLQSLRHIAVWNIEQKHWFGLGSGIGGHFAPYVNAMAWRGPDLYAGGYFSLAGGDSASNVARWDGNQWRPLGSGVNGTVRGMIAIGNDIYFSGTFTNAGAKASFYFGIWHEAPLSAPDAPASAVRGLRSWPNPTTGSGQIGFTLQRPTHVTVDVVNLRGEVVSTLYSGTLYAGDHIVNHNLAPLPDGTYLYRLNADGNISSGMVTVAK